MALLECDKSVQDAVAAGLIDHRAVVTLVKLDRAEQPAAVKEIIAAGATGPRAAKAAVDAAKPEAADKPKKQSRRPRAAVEAKIAELEEEFRGLNGSARERSVTIVKALKYALGEDTL